MKKYRVKWHENRSYEVSVVVEVPDDTDTDGILSAVQFVLMDADSNVNYQEEIIGLSDYLFEDNENGERIEEIVD